MLVKEIADQKHPFIYEDELATKARATIRDLNLRILPVTDKHKQLLGKISRQDIMTISSSVSPMRTKGVMRTAKHVATMEDDAYSTVRVMLQVDVWHAPVVTSAHHEIYGGVVGLENFIEPLIKKNPEKFLKDISEIMTKDVVTCSPEDEIDNIWRLMQKKRFAGLPVVRNDKMVGIVTAKDLLKEGSMLPTFEAQKGRFKSSSKISSIMKTEVTTVEPSTKAIKVARVMISKDIGRVPVTEKNGKLIGIVDREDIARLVAR